MDFFTASFSGLRALGAGAPTNTLAVAGVQAKDDACPVTALEMVGNGSTVTEGIPRSCIASSPTT